MWFYIPTILLIIVFGWWLRRTNLFRHFRRGNDPAQQGYGHSAGHYEGPYGNPGQSSPGGGGPGG